MKLNEVTLQDLSAIQHTIRLPNFERFTSPEFKVLTYTGEYRSGAGGKEDALYIVATASAAHEAWYTSAIILDFTELKYEWGDNMGWILNIGHSGPTDCHFPLFIVVGPKCESALRTLLNEEYEAFCYDSLDSVLSILNERVQTYRNCLQDWRAERKKG
jgi:hypothetical protein